jgi:plastocyanin
MWRLPFGIVLVILLTTGACSSLPDVTRTGRIHDVKVMEQQLGPAEITVRPGDEIRWLNYRTKPVRIIFLDRLDDSLSCARGSWGSEKNDVTIKAAKAASLCFSKPGEYKYNARLEAEVTGGEIPMNGLVRVQRVE